jgi:putative membrane protein
MLSMIVTMGLLAAAPPPERSGTSLPRTELPPVRETEFQGEPTDPLFAKSLQATDDPAFVLLAIESARQGVTDARAVRERVPAAKNVREVAQAIERQHRETTNRLEQLARGKHWRVPEDNDQRESSQSAQANRDDTNFILNQIAAHESTVALFRAQAAGKGDPELRKAAKEALSGYEKNLDALLRVKPDALGAAPHASN